MGHGAALWGYTVCTAVTFYSYRFDWVYLSFGDLPAIAGILYGIKPAVTAIVVFAAYRIGSRVLKNNVLRAMAILAFIAIFAFDIAFPYIVLMASNIGYAGSRISPNHFKAGAGHSASKETYGVVFSFLQSSV